MKTNISNQMNMMKIMTFFFLSMFLVYSSGLTANPAGVQEFKLLFKNITSATNEATRSLSASKSAQSAAAVLNTYGDKMEKYSDQLDKLDEKYSELTEAEEPPAELEKELAEMETAFEAFAESLDKVSESYEGDDRFREAAERVASILTPEEDDSDDDEEEELSDE